MEKKKYCLKTQYDPKIGANTSGIVFYGVKDKQLHLKKVRLTCETIQ